MRVSLDNGQELVIELPGGHQLLAVVSKDGDYATAFFCRQGLRLSGSRIFLPIKPDTRDPLAPRG